MSNLMLVSLLCGLAALPVALIRPRIFRMGRLHAMGAAVAWVLASFIGFGLYLPPLEPAAHAVAEPSPQAVIAAPAPAPTVVEPVPQIATVAPAPAPAPAPAVVEPAPLIAAITPAPPQIPTQTPASALGLGMSMTDFADRFNAVARRLNTSMRATETECAEVVLRACGFEIRNAAASLTSLQDKRTARDLTFFVAAADADLVSRDTMEALAIVLIVLEPRAGEPERQGVYRALFGRSLTPGQTHSARIGRTRVTLAAIAGVGLRLTVDRA